MSPRRPPSSGERWIEFTFAATNLSELLQSKAVVVLIQNEFLRVTPQ